MSSWFVLNNDKVAGPFREDEIKAQLTSGLISNESLVWGQPQDSWKKISWWVENLSQLTASLKPQNMQQLWHYAIDGVSKGPMLRSELVAELKNARQKDEILVWTKGMKAWSDLFEFHDLIEEIGMNRREHPRSSIDGSVVLKIDDKTMIGRLRSISPGGFGANQVNSFLSIGQVVQVELKADRLGDQPISVKAIVQYVTDAGFVGFKFTNISMENKARIVEHIRTLKPAEKSAA